MNFEAAAYTKDVLGFVHLKGVPDGSAATSNTVGIYFAGGFRPIYPLYEPVIGTGLFCSINISNTGEVKLTGSSISWLSVESMTFKAEQ